jgi:hypothetical protein
VTTSSRLPSAPWQASPVRATGRKASATMASKCSALPKADSGKNGATGMHTSHEMRHAECVMQTAWGR